MMIKIRNTLPLVCRRTTSSPFQLQDNQDQQASQLQKTGGVQLFHIRGSPKDRTKGSQKDSPKWDHQLTHQKCAKMSKPNEPTIGSQNDPTKGPHLPDYHDTLGFRQMELWLGNRLGAKIWRKKIQPIVWVFGFEFYWRNSDEHWTEYFFLDMPSFGQVKNFK